FTPYAAAIDDRVRAVVAAEGYLPVGWTVRSEDWNPEITADAVYQNVVGNVHDGAIVELHLDASTSVFSTAVALPWIVRDLRAAGYTFVTVPEMSAPCPRPEAAATPMPPAPAPAIGTPADARPAATPAGSR
ncbi:MAG: polysaccharide deacetylase family protein, partial [Chloroflexota bacterium]|nr:polysaccharide deacetylase family protein [Chloroflexota bacterium]